MSNPEKGDWLDEVERKHKIKQDEENKIIEDFDRHINMRINFLRPIIEEVFNEFFFKLLKKEKDFLGRKLYKLELTPKTSSFDSHLEVNFRGIIRKPEFYPMITYSISYGDHKESLILSHISDS